MSFSHALRGLVRSPAFTVAAVLSLALGIGANAAIFSVARALLLKPLPYATPDRLVILWNTSPGLGIYEDWFSTAQYFDIRQQVRGLDQVAIAIGGNRNLSVRDGVPARVGTIEVSSNLLPMLGAQPLLGRVFTSDDDVAGREARAILGHGTFVRRFGSDPASVGRAIILDGEPYTVIGVMPASFSLPREVLPTLGGAEDAEILVPLPLEADAATVRRGEDYNLLARLGPGATVDSVQSEMDGLTARLRREFPAFYPPNGGLRFTVTPLNDYVVGDVRRALLVLAGAVGMVLLIACVNVAHLQLTRAMGQQRELAVRAALGASRWRLARQMLGESLLLAAMGGVAGLVLADWSLDGIRWLGEGSVPRLQEIALDGWALAFTAVVSMASGVLFGLVPVLRAGRVAVHDTLKDAARGSAGAGFTRAAGLRGALVVGELALAVLLAVGAVLLVRSFIQVQQVPTGFDAKPVLTFELAMTGPRYDTGSRVHETYRDLWHRLDALPGIEASGAVSALPLSQMMAWGPITIEGRVPQPGEAFINVDQRIAAGRYFDAMRIPLLEGRLFGEQDTPESPRVTVIDDRMARTLWPGESALGKRIRRGGFDASSNAPWLTVVGVVGHVKQDALDADSRMAMYLGHRQSPRRAMTVVVRTAGNPEASTESIRQEIRSIDATLPMFRVKTMASRVETSLAERRFSTLLLGLFAALALALAIIGVYGVIAYRVSQGTRELGIRLALGATPGAITRLVVRYAAILALLGVTIGVVGALVLGRVVESLLFGVTARDIVTFTLVPAALALVAVLASYLPARRASRIDPTEALRAE
jgi:predicted permease